MKEKAQGCLLRKYHKKAPIFFDILVFSIFYPKTMNSIKCGIWYYIILY
ncbi:hypothetical protein midi_01199 [Candidatus Midichloria mitochondrii IricVA]|uniref:Uncharacterized protein n=1 Tax=Midichloria mitochondrii (strain IricVA) TaxID=696127 RepID=F7XUB6_MIDMI|nr:hypothetical protein midi_01199 [Candidatus Midichloria mitochondrii IricVA]